MDPFQSLVAIVRLLVEPVKLEFAISNSIIKNAKCITIQNAAIFLID